MKKLTLAFILIFLMFSSISFASKDQDGFKGFPWGTDFTTIVNDKNLIWEKSENDEGVHISQTDSDSTATYRYIFYDNKLIGGNILFKTEQGCDDAMGALMYQFGKPNRAHGYTWWSLPSTEISSPFFSLEIRFTSLYYLLETKPKIEKRRQQEKFDKYFN